MYCLLLFHFSLVLVIFILSCCQRVFFHAALLYRIEKQGSFPDLSLSIILLLS